VVKTKFGMWSLFGGRQRLQHSQKVCEEDHDALKNLASQRDAALSKTAGSLLQALYAASRDVLSDVSWTNKHLCPVCEVAGDAPLLPSIETKLNAFELVADTTAKIEAEWIGAAHEPTLHCPNCNHEIRLTESLAAPLLEETRQRFNEQLAAKDAEVARKTEALRKEQDAVTQAREQIEDQVALRLTAERSQLVATEARKAREAVAPITTTAPERIGPCTRMRRVFVRFNRSEPFAHTRSSAGFTIITSGFEFLVHTTDSLPSKPTILSSRTSCLSWRRSVRRSPRPKVSTT